MLRGVMWRRKSTGGLTMFVLGVLKLLTAVHLTAAASAGEAVNTAERHRV